MEPDLDLSECDPNAVSEALDSSSSNFGSASSDAVPSLAESNESGEDSEPEPPSRSALAPYSFEPSDESNGDSSSASSTSEGDVRGDRLSDFRASNPVKLCSVFYDTVISICDRPRENQAYCAKNDFGVKRTMAIYDV